MQLHFDLRQLKSFVTVAQCGSFSRASNILCIAQPALSRQIRLLEEALNTQLFLRHSRGVVLTSSGDFLLERAECLLADFSQISHEIAAVSGEITGEVSLGLIPSVAHSLAGEIIQQYRESYPKVSLVVEVALSGSILELTEQKKINLALTYLPSQKRNLKYTKLMEESLYLIGPVNSPIKSLDYLTLAQALKYPLVLAGQNHGLRSSVDKEAESLNLAPIIGLEVNDLTLQLDLVKRSVAHTILPLATVQNRANTAEFTYCEITSPTLKRTLVMAIPTDKPPCMASLKLQEVVESVCRQQIINGKWPGSHLCE